MTDPTAALVAGLSDRYTLERPLGRGGMATVYLARDVKHERPVALKVLLPELAVSLGPDRFQREVKLAARLQHPHILTVHDSGETAGQLWFTMPFVDGESLRDRLRREGRLPLEEALRITREAAQALQYAHEQGVVHRDIKPENLLLTRDGSTLVADFGIARAVGGDERLTQTGSSMGTPAYMSPEQANAERALDARTDVYSLACVLYEMLAGEPPFTGATAMAVISKWFTEPVPSVRAVRPDVPEGVDQAIQRALARSAADRVAGMAEFVRALQGEPSAFTPVPAPVGLPLRVAAGRGRVARAAVALGLSALVAGGFFAWRRTHGGAGPVAGPKVLAVLPFENVGDSADAYFADGVADEIRAKLAQIAGLDVIARASSLEYRHTARPPNAVARELGADYLLTGTVRWDKSGGGNRVRVLPELVDVRGGGVAHTRWTQQFEVSLTDVFQVQADIADKVADALGIALADSARRGLAAQPTDNLVAWGAFLQGEEAAQGMKADQTHLRQAIGFYERAVSLDSTFAQAWAQLSRARSSLYSNGVPDTALAEAARAAAERARTLRPDDPLVYLAAGEYFSSVSPIDNNRAAAEYQRGLRLAPGDAELLSAVAISGALLQRWDSVVPRLERAMRLDPRSFTAARRLATAHIFLRQFDGADSALDRAIALAPTNPQMVLLKVMVWLGRGDLAGARGVVRAATKQIDDTVLLAFLATYQDLYWVLDDAQLSRALRLSPDAFDEDRAVWGIVHAEIYHLRHDERQAAIYADSARRVLEEQSRVAPEDAQRHVLLGLALAYLGQKAAAIREGRRGVELLPSSRDAYQGPYIQHQLVRIYLLVGEPEKALDQLEPLLKIPYYLSPGWLRIDPTFAPLKGNPRFERLVARR